jgi:YD repeat-containing protein
VAVRWLGQFDSGSQPLGTVNYTYDLASRRSTIQVVGQTQETYAFDNANRLTSITQGNTSVGLNYDAANRRTCLSLPNGVTQSYVYDNDARITSIGYGTGGSCSNPPINLGNLSYTYDADGHPLSMGGSLAAVTLPASVSVGLRRPTTPTTSRPLSTARARLLTVTAI